MAAGAALRMGGGVAVGATRNVPSGVGGGDWVAVGATRNVPSGVGGGGVAEDVSSVCIDGIGVAAAEGDASGAVTVAFSSPPQAT